MKIIWSPLFAALKKEIQTLEEELSKLILKKDHLVLVVGKNLETAYLLAFGQKEYRIYQLQVALSRLKRKGSLIQAKINRKETIDVKQIEAVLEKEFCNYQQNLRQKMQELKKVEARADLESLSPLEMKELKSLYHHLVKKCHPDLHPKEEPFFLDLFQQAVIAYKKGDLLKLRLLNERYLSKEKQNEAKFSSLVQLREEKKRLEELLSQLQLEIKKIQEKFPFNQAALLKDPKKMMAYQEELEKLINSYEASYKEWQAKIKSLLRRR